MFREARQGQIGRFAVPRLLGEKSPALAIRCREQLGGARCAARRPVRRRHHPDTGSGQWFGQPREGYVLVVRPTVRPVVAGSSVILAALVDVADMAPVTYALCHRTVPPASRAIAYDHLFRHPERSRPTGGVAEGPLLVGGTTKTGPSAAPRVACPERSRGARLRSG